MEIETVMEGGRRFMAAWRNEEVDAAKDLARKRERQRDWKSCYRILPTWYKTTPIALVDEPKELCTGARRTET